MKFHHLKPWQKKMLCACFLITVLSALLFLTSTGIYLIADKRNEEKNWQEYLTEADTYTPEETAAMENAVQVSTGTYIERLDNIDIKNSKYTVTFRCWFNWDGHEELDMEDNFEIFEGVINRLEKKAEHRENGSNYQLFEVTADVSKVFSTKRFPLGSYQLRLYLKPLQNIERIVFVPDKEGSGVSPHLSVPGFALERNATALFLYRQSAQADGAYYKEERTESYSEVLTALELNRNSLGVYIKCVIALIGSNLWALTALFLSSHHRIPDALGLLPAVLLGTVTNIMVGANLVPDALHTGLLEFINMWGIYIIMVVTAIIIVINRIRSKYNDEAFAEALGKIMFYTTAAVTVAGHIVLPVAAYKF